MSLHIDGELLTYPREARGRARPALSGVPGFGTRRLPRETEEKEGRFRRALNGLSRLWVDRHGGEGAASVVAAVLARPFALDLLFPGWDEPSERRLSPNERELLRKNLELLSHLLRPRERYVLWRTSGALGEPQSLADISRHLGLTRERVRQIERTALGKLGISLPRGTHRSVPGRRRRARLLLRKLILA